MSLSLEPVRTLPGRIVRRGLRAAHDLRGRIRVRRDLDRIGLLRRAPAARLRDIPSLERLIRDLGLYPCGARSMEEFPRALWPYCGRGLRLWQYPNQFARCLAELARYPIRSYLEIGVAHGGTFIAVVEYLKRFNGPITAVGVDPCPKSELLREYIRTNAGLRYVRDLSCNLPKRIDWQNAFFDLVLIDGFHDEETVWADFQLVRDRADIVIFHDITNDRCPGVGAAWGRFKREHGGGYVIREFTEQYPEVRDRTGNAFLGMGMAIPRSKAVHVAAEGSPS